jgi:ribonuclease P protein component
MNTRRETFDKSERLCSTKLISGLFEKGNSFYTSFFKVVWVRSPVALPQPAQIAFSVPKKRFRLAVTRNLIRRRMREAWRKNKFLLYDSPATENSQIILIIIMTGKSVPDYLSIEKSIKEIIGKLRMSIREVTGDRSRKTKEGSPKSKTVGS